MAVRHWDVQRHDDEQDELTPIVKISNIILRGEFNRSTSYRVCSSNLKHYIEVGVA